MNATTCFLAELAGTALLILLGNGVVANVLLEKSGMKGGGTVQITFGWGLAVLMPVFIFGAASGAHFNPALTLALAADGSLAPELVGWYIAGQMLGAAIKGIAQVPGIAGGVGYLLVFTIIVSIGMSMGGLTGYAINPARDIGPRIVYSLLPMANKAPANWRYAWVPALAPFVGALAAVGLYKVFPWPA